MLPTSIPLKCQLHALHAKLDLLAQILVDVTDDKDWKKIEDWLFVNSLPTATERWNAVPHDAIDRALALTKSHPNLMVTRLGWDFWRIARRALGRETAHPLYSHVRNRWEKRPLTPIFKKELDNAETK